MKRRNPYEDTRRVHFITPQHGLLCGTGSRGRQYWKLNREKLRAEFMTTTCELQVTCKRCLRGIVL